MYEIDFNEVGEQQYLVCHSEHCQLHLGIGYCQATANNVTPGHHDMVGEGQYLIVLKHDRLQLIKGNACLK